MVKRILYIGMLVFGAMVASAQVNDTTPLPEYATSEDSLVFSRIIMLKPVTVVEMHFDNAEERRLYRQAKYRVNKVYPYAMQALEMMKETDEELAGIKKKRKQKKYLNNEHKDLKDQYAEFLKDFTVEEGRTLIKIIERATGESFYDVIKKYKSGMTATYWNTMANIQGYSLKDGYDPQKDKYIEMVLSQMEGEN